MGLESGPAQAARPPMLLTWPIPPDDDVMSLETKAAAQMRTLDSTKLNCRGIFRLGI